MSSAKKKKLENGYQINVASGTRQLIIYDKVKAPNVPRHRYDKIVDQTDANHGNPLPDVWEIPI